MDSLDSVQSSATKPWRNVEIVRGFVCCIYPRLRPPRSFLKVGSSARLSSHMLWSSKFRSMSFWHCVVSILRCRAERSFVFLLPPSSSSLLMTRTSTQRCFLPAPPAARLPPYGRRPRRAGGEGFARGKISRHPLGALRSPRHRSLGDPRPDIGRICSRQRLEAGGALGVEVAAVAGVGAVGYVCGHRRRLGVPGQPSPREVGAAGGLGEAGHGRESTCSRKLPKRTPGSDPAAVLVSSDTVQQLRHKCPAACSTLAPRTRSMFAKI